jgi:hypothetical protein
MIKKESSLSKERSVYASPVSWGLLVPQQAYHNATMVIYVIIQESATP